MDTVQTAPTAAATAAAVPPAAHAAAHAATEHAIALHVTGSLMRPLALSLDDLQAFPAVTCAPFDLRCYTTQRFIRTVEPYRGVLLTDLIQHAGVRCDTPGEFKRMIFVALGHDGYAVMFSWHELFNTPVGQQAIIAYECGGKALSEESGAPVLFSGADLVPAPRHVKRLARIEARVIQV
ncbi:molybdopterin-dependent oxidoreductase [Paraburkholderia ferrariae]|jgi:DMSO/TMAO reductase YedYZ molybdopterin-dependent catalytic subunit|uniref:molybdopterin-dependent oxidoreductase n=1 Tax=Paraburkholderia ferrariae TaxID=386056 RepID=UPI000A038862|nr:molybdopterin-dependent oxidoreductase [Paraburkholderia ferrariae]